MMNAFYKLAEVSTSECTLSEIAKSMKNKTMEVSELDKAVCKEVAPVKGCPIEGKGGNWSGERGNSEWIPDKDYTPPNLKTNPNELTWKEIFDKYNIECIPFKDGEPDFSKVLKGEVKIDNFTSEREDNFSQADEKLAEQKGCTPEDVAKWRKENKYTWHECTDCSTMQKVPTEVHGNVSHSGGISAVKSREVE